MLNIIHHVFETNSKTRAKTILTALGTLLVTFLGTIAGVPQAHADDRILDFNGSDTLVTNTGAVKNLTIKKIDDLNLARYSDVYFLQRL